MSLAIASKPSRVEGILDQLREYSNKRVNSALMDNRRCFSPHIVLDFGNMGLLGQQVPENYGGLELSNQECMAISSQIGAIDLSLAIFVGLHNFLGIRPIMEFSNDSLRDYWLPQVASGRKLTAFALTEPVAGSNAGAIEGTARQLENNFVRLNAEKMWIGNASWASVINVFVRYQDIEGRPFGINGYLVEQGTEGLDMGAELMTMGMRGMVQNRFSLNNVEIPSVNQLGKVGQGLDVAQDAMMYTRLALGAIFLGAMKRTQQLILRFAERREKISTGRLLDHPVCMIKMSETALQTNVHEALVNYISESLDRGVVLPEEFLITAKVMGSEFLWSAADTASQLMGGRGYIETNEITRIIRDARIGRVFEGPTETMMNYMGSRFTSKNNELVEYLRSSLLASDLIDQLHEAQERINFTLDNNQNVFEGLKKRNLINSLLGECIAWVILCSVVRKSSFSSSDSRTLHWIEMKLSKLLDNLSDLSINSEVAMETSELKSHIDTYHDSIGDMNQSLPGEEWEIDTWLAKAANRPNH